MACSWEAEGSSQGPEWEWSKTLAVEETTEDDIEVVAADDRRRGGGPAAFRLLFWSNLLDPEDTGNSLQQIYDS